MKTMNKLFLGLGFCAGLVSCSDFDEVNTNPTAAGEEYVKPQYALNNSIGQAQMNPGTAERVVVYNWASAARICGEMSFLNVGRYSDDYTSAYYYPDLSSSIKNATLAITAVENQLEAATTTAHEKEFFPNVKQFARIWRAYLISEFVDNFGPYPIESFLGENPVFNSEKDDYEFILKELKEAAAAINTSVLPVEAEGKCDPFDNVKYDPVKWQKYANSLRMRLAMRLSNIDKATAQTEFEDAAKGAYISESGDNFTVKEQPGWDDLTGVMTREWNYFPLSATMNNLLVGLGGITSDEQLAGKNDLLARIKPADYMGVQYTNHYALTTNDPAKGFWFDGLHKVIDPRAYKLFSIPGNFDDANYCKYPSWNSNHKVVKRKLLKDKDDADGLVELDATFTWNTAACGEWGDKGSLNKMYYWPWAIPHLVLKYRKSENSRIFFASWESYFLLAEAALKGWSVPMGAKAAYEQGVRESFAYHGVGGFADAYLASEDYNNVGTSVKWEHVAEPAATKTMKMVNGYTKAESTYTFTYPVASETLYGKALNDHLTKIITQKYIAQMPWLPLEAWNDQRRLGLPFFETPAVEQAIRTMPSLNASNYMKQTTKFFPQRLKFPSGLENSSPEGYKQAVQLLGGPDDVFTPLWWAKK